MEIVTLPFENKLILTLENQTVQITAFLTEDPGNIKLGINAPRDVAVNREEIHIIKQRQLNATKEITPTQQA